MHYGGGLEAKSVLNMRLNPTSCRMIIYYFGRTKLKGFEDVHCETVYRIWTGVHKFHKHISSSLCIPRSRQTSDGWVMTEWNVAIRKVNISSNNLTCKFHLIASLSEMCFWK